MTAPGDSHVDVLVAIARLEGKVDAALAAQGAKVDEHARRLDNLEPRVQRAENRPAVTPRAMWLGLGTLAAIAAAAQPVLDRLYS